jgi:hypothetical protein
MPEPASALHARALSRSASGSLGGSLGARERETGPTLSAMLNDGPLRGRSIEAELVDGRPPKIIDVPGDDRSTCR